MPEDKSTTRYRSDRGSPTAPEPPQLPTKGRPVWDLVIDDMRRRDADGRQKYGTPLQAYNGRDPLVDAYQETLDKAAYLRQEIEERAAARRLEAQGACLARRAKWSDDDLSPASRHWLAENHVWARTARRLGLSKGSDDDTRILSFLLRDEDDWPRWYDTGETYDGPFPVTCAYCWSSCHPKGVKPSEIQHEKHCLVPKAEALLRLLSGAYDMDNRG